MSYTNPKVYFADPTAFQKGFEGNINKYIEIQREQIEKQKKQDALLNKELDKVSTGLYDSDAYKNASKSVRDTLSNYFNDVKKQYISASQQDKAKIMADAIAEANDFVSSYQTTNQAKGNTLSIDYLGQPIEDFMFSEGPAIAEYRNGQLGITYGDKSNFLPKKNMFKQGHVTAKEVEDDIEKGVNELLDYFNKNNKASANFTALEESKNFKINDYVESLTEKQKLAYATRFKVIDKIDSNQTLEQAISSDLEERFANTRVYNESKVLAEQQRQKDLLAQKQGVVTTEKPYYNFAEEVTQEITRASEGTRIQSLTGLNISDGKRTGKIAGIKKLDQDNFEVTAEFGAGKDKVAQPINLSLSREDGRTAMKNIIRQYIQKNTTGTTEQQQLSTLNDVFARFTEPQVESTLISTAQQNIQLP